MAKSVSVLNLARVARAARYSFAGLAAAARHEAAFRQELVLFVVLAPLGLWLGNGPVERVLLVGSLVLVLIVELLNSAVEAVVDRIGADRDALSGRAKDVGSAAVFVAIALAVLSWSLLLLPRWG